MRGCIAVHGVERSLPHAAATRA